MLIRSIARTKSLRRRHLKTSEKWVCLGRMRKTLWRVCDRVKNEALLVLAPPPLKGSWSSVPKKVADENAKIKPPFLPSTLRKSSGISIYKCSIKPVNPPSYQHTGYRRNSEIRSAGRRETGRCACPIELSHFLSGFGGPNGRETVNMYFLRVFTRSVQFRGMWRRLKQRAPKGKEKVWNCSKN